VIRRIDFDDTPIRVGEYRALLAWADAPLEIIIRCFTKDPPPAGYKPCPECGVIKAANGQSVPVQANDRIFSQPGGTLEVTVRDETGDSRQFLLRVRVESSEPEPMTSAGG
jgi:hypothetical protein